MAEWKLRIPLRKPLMSLNDQRRAHWTQVAKAKADTAILVKAAATAAKLVKISTPITVRLVWYAPDARSRDCDGLAPMMKAILDALVSIGVIVDDNSKIVYDVRLGPIVIARDDPRFEILIKEIEADDAHS